MNFKKLLFPLAVVFTSLLAFTQAKAQTTITTTFANNNGSGMVTFNFVNNSANAVNITEIGSVCGSSTLQTVTAWYKPGGISGPPGTIDPGNGWTQFGSGTITGISNSSTTTAQTFFPTATSTLTQITVPAGATYGMAVSSTNLRYSTLTAGTYTVSGGSCDIVTGTNIGYGGSVPPTAPTLSPRGFIGYVTYVPAVPCTGTPNAGTAITSTANPCSGSSAVISLSGGTVATGMSYQLQSSTNNTTFTALGAASSSPQFVVTPTVTTYYRIVSTCTNSSNSNTSSSVLVSGGGVVTVLPYIESFNSGTLPNCWTNDNSISSTSATMFWKFTGAPGYGTNSNGRTSGTFAWVDASSPYNGVVTLTSPVINLSSLTVPFVRFEWYKDHSSSSSSIIRPTAYPNNNLKLEGYNGSSWVTLFDDTSNASQWRIERITLPASFAGVTNAQFRFSVDKSLSNYQYDDVLLDSFVVMNAPSCFAPTSPSIVNASSTSATFGWTAATPAPGVGYQYEVRSSGAAGSGPTGRAAVGTTTGTTTTATATGLSPVTTYSLYVRSICGPGDTSAWASGGTFTTACAALPAPYTQGFNSGSLPNCWTNDNSISSTSATMFWKFTGAPGYGTNSNGRTSGTFAWVDASSPYNGVVTLTSPVINLSSLTTPFVRFEWYKDHSSSSSSIIRPTAYPNNNLKLEGYNGSSWVTLFDDTSNASQWRIERITLPASFAGVTNAQFRFSVDKSLSNFQYDDVLLDSFVVINAPSCIAPTSPSIVNASSTSATFDWTAPTPAPGFGYQYEVRSSGAAGSGPTGRAAVGTTTGTTTTATATGLSPVTTYSLYVRSICGPGDTSAWASGGTFTTACAVFTAPYYESFNATTIPACWTNSNSASSTSTNMFWKFTGTPGYGTTANGRPVNSYAWVDASSPYTGEVILTSPFLDLSGLSGAIVKFDWFKNNSSTTSPDNNLKLEGYNGSSWVTLFDSTSNATYWRTVTIILPASFAGVNNAQFRFSVDKTLSNDFYDDVLLDSFSVVNGPCPVPTNIAVTNITAGGATISWTAPVPPSASGYQYEVRTSGAAGSGASGLVASGSVPAGVTSATVSGLMANTNVTVYVRGLCSPTNGSVWTAGYPFQTSVCSLSVDLGPDTAICSAGSLTLDAENPGSAYLWSTGATTQTITVSAIGSYSVVVSGAGGCIDRDTIYITHRPALEVELGDDTTICSGSRLILNAGHTGSTYLWNTGAITQTVSVVTAGTYSVQLTDVDGCSGRDTIIINVLQAPTLSLGNDTTLCVGSPLLLNAGNAGSTYSWNTGATTRTIPVLVSGTYSVAVVAPSGCSVKDTIKVTMNPLPEAGTIAISGQAPTFTFSVIGSAHVANSGWIFGDGSVSTAQSPTHTYAASGTYTVTYFVANACGVDSTTRKLSIGAGGVQNTVLENEIQLFPNPADHFVTIQNNAAKAMKTIRILDIAGAVVHTVGTVNGTEQRIDISRLAAGSYIIRIELESGAVALRKMQIVR